MDNEFETQDSILEGEQDTTPETESVDETAKLKEYAQNQKIRAEKAEKELKAFRAQQQKTETETPTKEETKSNEPDYAKEAFLEQRGVEHPDDKKIVYDEAKRLNLPLTDVLGMEHIKSKLKSSKTQREAESGMPSGGGKGGSGATKNTVEYWIDKRNADGTYQTPEDVELANKVISARMKSESNKSMFEPIRV